MADATVLSRCAAIARRDDHERYLCALFAPPARREDLFTLLAFNAGIAGTRERVSEPMIGQIRLQWWRESLDGIEAGAPRRHEVVTPLADLMARQGLQRTPLDRLIDARDADFDDVRFETLERFRDYARETSVPLAEAMLDVLGVSDGALQDRARRIAEGYAITGLLRATVFLARTKRTVIPDDVAIRHGLRHRDLYELRDHVGLRDAVAEIAAIATELLVPGPMPKATAPVLLQAVLARRHLATLRRHGYDVTAPALTAVSPARVWTLSWAALWGRG